MACTFSTFERPKVAPHFFDIWTSKSGPNPSVFDTFDVETCFAPQRRALFRHLSFQKNGPTLVCAVHFELEMCFAPQRRALFEHLNFQKWSEREVSLAFLLPHVLRATSACNFSSLMWPAGSAPAALARLPFSTLWGPKSLEKKQWIVIFLPFCAPASHFFSFLIFSLLCFSSLTLPTSAFPTVHIVESFTSKLPSIIKSN